MDLVSGADTKFELESGSSLTLGQNNAYRLHVDVLLAGLYWTPVVSLQLELSFGFSEFSDCIASTI